jgi:hypothetical protein
MRDSRQANSGCARVQEDGLRGNSDTLPSMAHGSVRICKAIQDSACTACHFTRLGFGDHKRYDWVPGMRYTVVDLTIHTLRAAATYRFSVP